MAVVVVPVVAGVVVAVGVVPVVAQAVKSTIGARRAMSFFIKRL